MFFVASPRRRSLRTVGAIVVAVALAAGTGIASAVISQPVVALLVSSDASHSSPKRLTKTSLLGPAFIFVSNTSGKPIATVDYYVDDALGDTTPLTATAEPFDIAPGGLDTTKLSNGPHFVLVVITTTSGVERDLFARFAVSNGGGTGTAAKPAPSPSNSLRLYADTSFWNIPIAAGAALDPDSATMISGAFVPRASDSSIANADYGTPVYYSTNADPMATVSCTQYCEQGDSFQMNVPADARPSGGSDGHLVIINTQSGVELDMWLAEGGGTSWTAASVATSDAHGWGANCAEGQHCNGSNAAGFSQMGGVIRPEELASGTIDHALAVNTPFTRSGDIVCPATHTDGQTAGNSAIPEGPHIQLDPSIDIDSQSWESWQKTVAHALQTYGAFVVDTSGAVTLRGQSNGEWGSVGQDPSLNWLPWDSMRVLLMKQC